MAREKPPVETLQKHPHPYQRDLNPDATAGQNLGISEAQPESQGPTAYDVKPAPAVGPATQPHTPKAPLMNPPLNLRRDGLSR